MTEDNYPYAVSWSRYSVRQLFANLMSYTPSTSSLNIENIKDKLPVKYKKPFDHGFVFVTRDSDLYDFININVITDFFTERIRLSTSKRKFMSETPMQMWKKYWKEIIDLAEESYGSREPFHVRLAAFKYTKESVNFRPTIALSIYHYFLPRSILDISAGWGDRLIAALAYAQLSHADRFERYIAFDPNVNLQPSYNEIVDMFIPSGMNKNQFQVFSQPFEQSRSTLKRLHSTFDLVFTSIPYFDFEQYDIGDGRGQSIVKYKDLRSWISHFLVPSISICAEFLEEGGYLALNMEGYFVTKLFQEYDHVFRREGLRYQGIFGYTSDLTSDRIVHPMYVWRLNSDESLRVS